METEILIVGGGLAGLTAALHLQKNGFHVTLVEKNLYPNHKVCGEYISNEVLPYLKWLGLSFDDLGSSIITEVQFTTQGGSSIIGSLPLGGFGLSRYALDNYLYQEVLKRGVSVYFDTVISVSYQEELFAIETFSTMKFIAKQVLGAFGKRSGLDKTLERKFMHGKSPYLAVKAHYEGDFPGNRVALHNFDGGYCGVSKVEDKKLNICYLANYASFKQYRNVETFQHQVLYKNKFLRSIFENSRMISATPLTIAQISFGPKELIVDHIIMIGDTAALIHPLCGNGMAMAIHSAKISAELITGFLQNKQISRAAMEREYKKQWKNLFQRRLYAGKVLSAAFKIPLVQKVGIGALVKIPALLSRTIKMTHGNPIEIL